MIPREPFRLPPARARDERRAVLLAWLTFPAMGSVVAVLYLLAGASQAMRAEVIENALGLLPSAAFLVALRAQRRPPSPRYPYGRYRATSIAFLVAAVAIAALGTFVVVEALTTLLRGERPTIGAMEIGGRTVWQGWPMLVALGYSTVVPMALARAKLPLARRLHAKVLHADAEMGKAEWRTSGAAILGVLGVGAGLWWADAAAALAIGLDVLADGLRELGRVVRDLMDERPTTVEADRPDPVVARLRTLLRQLPWVADAGVRLREEGQALTGEAFVVPRRVGADLLDHLEDAAARLRAADWRVYDVAVVPVRQLPPAEDDGADASPS